MGEGAHVAGALHVVLAAQRVDADPGSADIAGGHREVRHRHDHGRALAVLGHAEPVVDGGVRCLGVGAGSGTNGLGRNPGLLGEMLGAVLGQPDELLPGGEGGEIASLCHELTVDEALGRDDMAHGIDDRDVRARLQLQVVRGCDVGGFHEVDAARVDDDEPGAGAKPALHAGGEDRVGVGRVGADDDDDVGVLHRGEVLGARGSAEGLLEPVAGGGVAHPGAGIDIVVAEGGPDHLLDDVDLLIRAARRGDAADRVDAVGVLDLLEAQRGVVDRLVPRDLAPRVGDRLADHRAGDAVGVARVAPGEAALHAGVAGIGPAVLVGDHAHELIAAQLCLERAADPAVGACGLDRASRHAELDDALLLQGGGRAGLHARAARDALALEEGLAGT